MKPLHLVATLAFLTALPLSGCVSHAPPAPAAAATGAPVEPTIERAKPSAPVAAPEPAPLGDVQTTDCATTQADFLTPADEFEGAPDGFEPIADKAGMATIVAESTTCRFEGERFHMVRAYFLSNAPGQYRAEGREYGVLLSVWTDSAAVHEALSARNLSMVEDRRVGVSSTEAAAGRETRIQVEPDFVMTVQSVNAHEATPHGRVRLFSFEDKTRPASVTDVTRATMMSTPGPATASFIVQPTGSDLPQHFAGTGRILDERVTFTYHAIAP